MQNIKFDGAAKAQTMQEFGKVWQVYLKDELMHPRADELMPHETQVDYLITNLEALTAWRNMGEVLAKQRRTFQEFSQRYDYLLSRTEKSAQGVPVMFSWLQQAMTTNASQVLNLCWQKLQYHVDDWYTSSVQYDDPEDVLEDWLSIVGYVYSALHCN